MERRDSILISVLWIAAISTAALMCSDATNRVFLVDETEKAIHTGQSWPIHQPHAMPYDHDEQKLASHLLGAVMSKLPQIGHYLAGHLILPSLRSPEPELLQRRFASQGRI